MEWAAYERVYGSLLVHERIDMGFAMLATVIARTNGAKRAQPRDFMPKWYRDLERRQSPSPEALETWLKGLAGSNGETSADH